MMRKSLCLALLCIVLACTNIFPAFAMEVPAQESTYTAADGEAVSEIVTDIDVQTDTEMQSVSETTDEFLEGRKLTNDKDSGQSYISGLRVKSMIDGSAPFDDDDSAGNDSSDSNGIVRSFDEVNYSLEYVTALKNSENVVNEGYVNVEFVLKNSAKEVQFNDQTLNWCLDKQVTYYYADGTTDTVFHSEKDVVKQVLTGRRYLVNGDAGNAIPGTGTLSVGLKISAAVNGAEISPEFHVWMDGNERDEEKEVTADPVRVSATPKYNIGIVADGGASVLGYFDIDNGKCYTSVKDDAQYGRLARYAVVMSVYNDTVAKGLKGIEFPAGDITFDISATTELNNEVLTDNKDYNICLWDYIENDAGSIGYLGREMTAPSVSSYAYFGPANKNTNRTENACYDGGRIKMEQDEEDKNLYHCTITDYQIDYEQFHFPQRYIWSSAGDTKYSNNVGCISCANIEFLSIFPENVDTSGLLYQDIQIKKQNFTSASGKKITDTDMVKSDDRVRKSVVLSARGDCAKYQRWCGTNLKYLSSTSNGGDNAAYPGQPIYLESFIYGYAEFSYSDFNLLQKFDDEVVEIDDGSFKSIVYNSTKKGDIKMLLAAKADKSGWINDKEMNMAREEDLVFFDSIDELNRQGYTCVGVLYEIRNAETLPITASAKYYDLFAKMKVKSDLSTVGNVYQTVSDLRVWKKDRKDMGFSWTDYPYHDQEKIFGVGGDSTGYIDGYKKPHSINYSNNNYIKASYVDGAMYGHNFYSYGNSLLIISDNVSLTISSVEEDSDNSKTVFDLDTGERTAVFKIQPEIKINSAYAGTMTSDITDNLTVTATLPKGLYYNSSSIDPESLTKNKDGTTTIVWKYNDVSVKSAIHPLSVSTTIGEEGTANDVSNNDRLQVKAFVQSDNDKRAATLKNGKSAETSITIIKLAASSVTERAKEPFVERGEDIVFRMRYSNLSGVGADGVKLYNILPEDGDDAGSHFSGGYRITGIKVDFTNAPQTFKDCAADMDLYYTDDPSGKTEETKQSVLKSGTASQIFHAVSHKEGDKVAEWNDLDLTSATAIMLDIARVYGNEYLDVYLTISPVDKDGNVIEKDGKTQGPGDLYMNSFSQYAENQVEIVVSNVAKASVVKRTISGLTWIDKNSDGIRTDEEEKLSDVRVNLYQSSPEKEDNDAAYILPDGTKLYPTYDVYGNLNKEQKTDKGGSYIYEGVKAGEYYVVFEGTEGYGLTAKNKGDDDQSDSDADAIVDDPLQYEDIKNALKGAYISKIDAPEIKNMTETEFVSDNNDAGFTILPSPSQAVAKIADKTSGAEYDQASGRYNGSKAPGTYQNGETINFLLTVSNKGDCRIYDICLEEDMSDCSSSIKDVVFSINKGDTLKTKQGNSVILKDLVKSGEKYNLVFDQLEAGDSFEINVSGTVQNKTQETKRLTNTVSLSSVFNWSADGSEKTYELKTPDTIINDENYSVDKDVLNLSGNDNEETKGSIKIVKTGDDGPLEGVAYKLVGDDGTSYDGTTDSDGTLVFSDLSEQSYTLTETETINGYQLLKDSIMITIPLKMTDEEVQEKHVDTSKGIYSEEDGCWYFYDLSFKIKNDAVLDMPDAGANNKYEWVAGLIAVFLFSTGVITIAKKRM